MGYNCDILPIKKVITQDFYIDDLESGGETKEESLNFYKIVTKILQQAGIPLRKLYTNSVLLMFQIQLVNKDEMYKLKIGENDTITTLGLI